MDLNVKQHASKQLKKPSKPLVFLVCQGVNFLIFVKWSQEQIHSWVFLTPGLTFMSFSGLKVCQLQGEQSAQIERCPITYSVGIMNNLYCEQNQQK